MSIILPNLNHSFIFLVPVPVPDLDFRVFYTPLFMTKICDFSYLIMANTADTVSLNIIYAGILLMVLSTMMKKQLLLKNVLD